MRLSKHEAALAHTLRQMGATLTKPVARTLGVSQDAPRLVEQDPELEPDPDLETEEQAAYRFSRQVDAARDSRVGDA